MLTTLKTPCIGVCSTGIGDSVCRGCKRFAHEVIHWNSYSPQERQAIFRRLNDLLSRVVEERLSVVDEQKLHEQLALNKVRVSEGLNANCLAYEAIRTFGSRLPGLELIGCKARPRWRGLSVAQLKESVESNFYELSCAHYQRYFPGHI